MIMGVFRSAVIGVILGYMTLAFGKGLGLSRGEQEKYTKIAEEL